MSPRKANVLLLLLDPTSSKNQSTWMIAVFSVFDFSSVLILLLNRLACATDDEYESAW